MKSEDDRVKRWLEDAKPSGWQGFVYFSEAVEDHHNPFGQTDRSLDVPENSLQVSVLPLARAPVGDRVRIVSLNCDESNQRLMGMGLMPGVVLQVVSCTMTGSVIVALQDQRLGLGAEMAQHIQVVDARERPGTDQNYPVFERTTMMQPATENSAIKLRDVAIGSTLKVVGYEPTARDYKRKLLAMGLTPGTELLVKRHAPLGDPTEIEVRGFRLSLRKAEADALIVEPA